MCATNQGSCWQTNVVACYWPISMLILCCVRLCRLWIMLSSCGYFWFTEKSKDQPLRCWWGVWCHSAEHELHVGRAENNGGAREDGRGTRKAAKDSGEMYQVHLSLFSFIVIPLWIALWICGSLLTMTAFKYLRMKLNCVVELIHFHGQLCRELVPIII